jgi:UDP-2,3-diacylglucosamine hydrolase
MKPLVFAADAHLTRDDPEVESFVSFLRTVGPTASALCILGDLFNIWLGKPKFALPHHLAVLDALEDLKARGVRLLYVEGNRDFHLRRTHQKAPFDAVTEDSLIETHAGWRVWATHGDNINVDDRQYRAWKAFSKSAPVYGAFSMLPGSWGMKLGESLERRLTGTNLRHKSYFPMDRAMAYARRVFDQGCHALVMGHFHEERFVPCGEREGRPLGMWVMPAWRGTHRYLVFDGDAEPRFVTFEE